MNKFIVISISAFIALPLTACETTTTDPVTITPPASNHAKLAGTSWSWATDLPSDPVIEFKANGHLGGYSGCNQISGVFEETSETEGGRHVLKMGQVISTEMACFEGMEIEQKFMKAISNIASFNHGGDSLSLFDGSGQEVLKLDRQLD